MAIEKTFPVSSIGEIRGFFDLFLPGMFVLLHIWFAAYCVSGVNTRKDLFGLVNSPALLVAISIPSGYLLGLVLRMIRTGFADRLSVRILLWFDHGCKFHGLERPQKPISHDAEKDFNSLKAEALKDKFPYPELMRRRVRRHLPKEAQEYYEQTWAPRNDDKPIKVDVFTFEFWKVLLASVDAVAAQEAYFLEVSVRLAAHMCYALFFCIVMLVPAGIFSALSVGPTRLVVLSALIETGAFLLMIYNFRFFRAGEVEHVFSLCFRNRTKLEETLKQNLAASRRSEAPGQSEQRQASQQG